MARCQQFESMAEIYVVCVCPDVTEWYRCQAMDDPFNLQRFVDAQDVVYSHALDESCYLQSP